MNLGCPAGTQNDAKFENVKGLPGILPLLGAPSAQKGIIGGSRRVWTLQIVGFLFLFGLKSMQKWRKNVSCYNH